MTIIEKALAYSLGGIIAAVVVLVLNFIPYLLWNKVVAVLFGWRHFTFWQIFLLCLAISWASRLIFAGIRQSKS